MMLKAKSLGKPRTSPVKKNPRPATIARVQKGDYAVTLSRTVGGKHIVTVKYGTRTLSRDTFASLAGAKKKYRWAGQTLGLIPADAAFYKAEAKERKQRIKKKTTARKNGPLTISRKPGKMVITHHTRKNPVIGIMKKSASGDRAVLLNRAGIGKYVITVKKDGKTWQFEHTSEAKAKKAFTRAKELLKLTPKKNPKRKAPVKKAGVKKNPVRRAKWYVGHNGLKRTPFRCIYTPTNKSHGKKYKYVTGPFSSEKAAKDFC